MKNVEGAAVGLVVIVLVMGVLYQALKNPTGTNQLITASSGFFSSFMKTLEGRG